jgi:hypothetical protein
LFHWNIFPVTTMMWSENNFSSYFMRGGTVSKWYQTKILHFWNNFHLDRHFILNFMSSYILVYHALRNIYQEEWVTFVGRISRFATFIKTWLLNQREICHYSPTKIEWHKLLYVLNIQLKIFLLSNKVSQLNLKSNFSRFNYPQTSRNLFN